MNVIKFKIKLIENNLGVCDLAEKIGVNKSTLYRKINGKGDKITIKEVNKIAGILNMSKEDIIDIFHPDYGV